MGFITREPISTLNFYDYLCDNFIIPVIIYYGLYVELPR